MMKTHILTLLFLLAGLAGMAQTNQPLPPDAQPLTALTYLSPSDSTVWLYNERSSLAINVGVWADVVELFNQKWSNTQVDSAITAQIGGINFPVTSVQGMTGAIMLSKSDLGLGNVDNTSDANKPISTATQDALDGKEDKTNKVTSLSTPNNTTYPTTEAVKNAIDAIEPPDVTGSNGIQVNSGVVSPVYGTAAGTVAQGNDSRINNGQTAYGWGDFRQFGLGEASPLTGTSWNSVASSVFIYSDQDAPTVFPAGISVGSNGRMQLASRGLDLLYRDRSAGAPWYTVWHSGNFSAPSVFTRSTNGYVPAPGGSGSTRYLNENGSWTVPTGGGGGGTATDLSIQNRTATTLQIGSSTGSAATLPIATTSLGGLMTAADKVKLNAAITDESDPTVPSHVKNITSTNISNWNTAYGWGDYRNYGLATGGAEADWNAVNYSGFIYSNTNAPVAFAAGINVGSNGRMQLASRFNELYFRDREAGLTWNTVWHSGSFTPSDYLKISNFTWPNLSGKPSAFPPSAHSHSASDINSGILSLSRIPTGTTGSTVALGNHTHSQYVPTSRTINAKALTANLSLTAADVNALPSSGGTLTGNLRINTYFAITQQSDSYRLDVGGSGYSTYNNIYLGRSDNSTGLYYGSGHQIWHAGNLTNPASFGTSSSQVRNNSQLDARYLQSDDNTVLRTTGNQTVGGTKTFSSPVVAPQYQGTSTTASSSIPTNAQSLFTASVSSNTSYTLTNLSGSPRHIQVMVTNTGGSQISITFNARFPVNQTTSIGVGQTAIFTFLVNAGVAYGTKTLYTTI